MGQSFILTRPDVILMSVTQGDYYTLIQDSQVPPTLPDIYYRPGIIYTSARVSTDIMFWAARGHLETICNAPLSLFRSCDWPDTCCDGRLNKGEAIYRQVFSSHGVATLDTLQEHIIRGRG